MTKHDFEDFARTSAGRRATAVLRKHKTTPEMIFTTVLAQVTGVLPHLKDDFRYTSEMLCGHDLWANWFTAERRVAGMCVAYFVNRKVVKLYKHLTPSRKGAAKYRTTPPPEPVGRPFRIVRLRRARSVRGECAGSVA